MNIKPFPQIYIVIFLFKGIIKAFSKKVFYFTSNANRVVIHNALIHLF